MVDCGARLPRREGEAMRNCGGCPGCGTCDAASEVERLRGERDEARAEVADLSNKYTESWKCSLDVPKDPCFDCIRCLRLRLKGRP